MGIVGVADQRPDHVAALVRDQLLQERIAIVGGGLEVAAECRLRIGHKHREVRLPVDMNIERPVVGDELGTERDDEKHREDDQRPVAAPVALEVLPAAAIERG